MSWLTRERATALAGEYIGVPPVKLLGAGKDGYVFLAQDRTAVKVFARPESFRQELAVYKRLRRLRISRVCGVATPRLVAASSRRKIIRMTVVSPPYLLDFAGARFEPPDFPDDAVANWHAEIAEFYPDNPSIPYLVYDELSRHGIYYTDFRPGNLNLEGL